MRHEWQDHNQTDMQGASVQRTGRVSSGPSWHRIVLVLGTVVLLISLTSCDLSPASVPPPPGKQGGPGSPDCGGYPEPRVFVEAQSWWTPTPGSTGKNDFGHLHLGTCFPYKQTVSGTTSFDFRVIMHDNPGTATNFRMGTEDVVTLAARDFVMTCGEGKTCEQWINDVVVDTADATHDGRNEMRASVSLTEPDGNKMKQSSGWQVYLENGKSSSDYRNSDETTGRGWYTGADYTNATLLTDIPLTPVSGVWRPEVSLDAGASGIPVTHHLVAVDPDFHHGNSGIVVKEGSGPFRGELAIDTTKLSDGVHRLFLRSDADCQGGNCGGNLDGQRNSGAAAIYFTVDNS